MLFASIILIVLVLFWPSLWRYECCLPSCIMLLFGFTAVFLYFIVVTILWSCYVRGSGFHGFWGQCDPESVSKRPRNGSVWHRIQAKLHFVNQVPVQPDPRTGQDPCDMESGSVLTHPQEFCSAGKWPTFVDLCASYIFTIILLFSIIIIIDVVFCCWYRYCCYFKFYSQCIYMICVYPRCIYNINELLLLFQMTWRFCLICTLPEFECDTSRSSPV